MDMELGLGGLVGDVGPHMKGPTLHIVSYDTILPTGGANLVRSMPFTEAVYSSMLGVRPRMAERTTTGVEARRDSPFLRSESSTTRPWKRRVEVAMTVSPLAAFS